MANLDGGNFTKFTVIKNTDVAEYLNQKEIQMLVKPITKIEDCRIADGKRPSNIYLVINTDEPYADEVIEILKRNGHWG